MALLVWLAVVAIMIASGPRLRPFHDLPIRGPALAGMLALVIGAFVFWQVRPQLPAGDEPHYLVITQSLLKDGDLRIENNHRQGDYREYFAGDLPPDFRVRGKNREIYSIHAPGVPAVVAPAFLVGGYLGVVIFLVLLSAAGSALVWQLARLVTGRDDAAWFGWAAVTCSATWVFHSFAVFPDGPGAVAVMTGVWALYRAQGETQTKSGRVTPWFWHGAALALLPWMHTRFAALAGALGALVLLRLGATPNALSKAGAFLAAPIVSAIAWIGSFIVIYGTPDPSVPYGGEPGSFAFVPDGLAGLLFDQGFGLVAYAPVLLASFAGLGIMLARRALRRQAIEFLFVATPYLVVVTHVAMWWGGTSAPARFFVPLLPWMAIPAAVGWTALSTRTARVSAWAALLFTVFVSFVLATVDDGAMAFNIKEESARWLTWLNGTVDLPRGLPIWFRERETPLFRGIAVWFGWAAAGWLVLRAIEGHPLMASRARFATVAAFVMAIAATCALSTTWRAERADGRSSVAAQLQVLRRVAKENRLIVLALPAGRSLHRETVASSLHIAPPFSTAPGGAGRNDRPLYAIPAVPAGDYRLTFSTRALEGWTMIGIGRDQFALQTRPLNDTGGVVDVSFPVDVRAIVVRVDEDARRNIQGLTLEPIRLVPPAMRLTDEIARRAVHYPGAIVYFLDDRSFPEPEAFWVGGRRESAIVLQPEVRGTAAGLLVRNGAAENTLLVQAGGWRETVRLAPGEERRVEARLDVDRGATLVRFTTSAGFTPSEVDPKSRDSRFLGVWMKVIP